jgi:hypothetical protein
VGHRHHVACRKFPHRSPCGLPPGLLRRYTPGRRPLPWCWRQLVFCLLSTEHLGAQKCRGRRQRRSIRVELSVALIAVSTSISPQRTVCLCKKSQIDTASRNRSTACDVKDHWREIFMEPELALRLVLAIRFGAVEIRPAVLAQLARGTSHGTNPAILLFTRLVFLIYSPVAEGCMAQAVANYSDRRD